MGKTSDSKPLTDLIDISIWRKEGYIFGRMLAARAIFVIEIFISIDRDAEWALYSVYTLETT